MAVRQQRRTRSDAGERPWTDAQPASRAFCQRFFTYYNTVHRHSGIGLHTPASVHDGTAEAIHAQRAAVLTDAYATNPGRFRQPPTPPRLPKAAWINEPPKEESQEEPAA